MGLEVRWQLNPPKVSKHVRRGCRDPDLGVQEVIQYMSNLQTQGTQTTIVGQSLLQSNQVKRFAQESRFGFVVQNLNSFFVRTSQV